MSKCGNKAKEEIKKSLQENPGAAIDAADKDKVNECLVEQETKMLNDNPRNDDENI